MKRPRFAPPVLAKEITLKPNETGPSGDDPAPKEITRPRRPNLGKEALSALLAVDPELAGLVGESPQTEPMQHVKQSERHYWSAEVIEPPGVLAQAAPAGERWYWQAKLVKNGPPVGIQTWFGPPWVDGEEIDRSPRWQALVRTETTARAILMGDEIPIEVHGVGLRNVEKITKAAYQMLVNHAAWSTEHKPENPDAAPESAVDVTKMDSLF